MVRCFSGREEVSAFEVGGNEMRGFVEFVQEPFLD